MDIRVLGPLEVLDDGRQVPLGGPRQRMVFATLVAHANAVVSLDRLGDAVWGDEPPSTARKSLQTYVSRLRKELGNDAIEAQAPGYVLHVGDDELDADRFERRAAIGHDLVSSDPRAAVVELDAALDLWRGPPLADLADDLPLRPYTVRLEERRLAAVEDRFEAILAGGDHAGLVGEMEAFVADHPYREHARGLLMLALYRSGRQAEALRAYQEGRRLWGEELGLEPGPELQQLESQILLHDPALVVSPAAEVSSVRARNPYKGLSYFTEADAADFCGREQFVDRLLGRLADPATRLVAVVGPSGSGKSSAVRAGLVPAVREGRLAGDWLVTVMRPGSHPFAQLEAALIDVGIEPSVDLGAMLARDELGLLRSSLHLTRGTESSVVLVIDQFEEVFTAVDDVEVRNRFLASLVEAIRDPHSRLVVVLTLRADQYDRPFEAPSFGELFAAAVVNLLPLTAVELESAIVDPAEAVGVGVEPELLAQLVADVAQEPAALPMLQFALTEVMERRSDSMLTVADYRALGGVSGAITRRCEEVFTALPFAEQGDARDLFLRLAAIHSGGDLVRRRLPILEACEPGRRGTALSAVVDTFAAARLLSLGRDAVTREATVEVAHEAVVAEWPRLRGWLREAGHDLELLQALATAAAGWEGANRDPAYLLTGSRLVLFEDWASGSTVVLGSTERQYLVASGTKRDELAAQEDERRNRELATEQRAKGRLRWLVAVLAGAVAVAVVLTAVAIQRSRDANREAEAALAAQTVAAEAAAETLNRELAFAATAVAGQDAELALLLALHTVHLSQIREEPVTVETIEALHLGLQEAGVQYPVADSQVIRISTIDGLRGGYHLPVDDLVALAHDNVTRDLTIAECVRFFSSNECPRLPARFNPGLESAPGLDFAFDSGGLRGTKVRIGGAETETVGAEVGDSELDAFAEASGIQVDREGPIEAETTLWEGTAYEKYDIVVAPQPFWVPAEASAGRLMDLGVYLDRERMVEDYGRFLISLGTVADDGTWPSDTGALHGAFLRLNVKSLIWYPVAPFAAAGWKVPETWDELIALSDTIVAGGGTPWCFAEYSGDWSGWPATDFVEDILIHSEGPETYDRWTAHEIAFDDPAVAGAFRSFGELVFTEGYADRPEKILAAFFQGGMDPVLADPPGCWLYHQGNFAGAWLPLDKHVNVDIAYFPTPSIDPAHAGTMTGSGEMILVYSDRPEVRELVNYLLSPEYGSIDLQLDEGVLAANRRFDYEEDDWRHSIAEALRNALADDLFRFDASDVMPPAVGAFPFYEGMVTYISEGPESLDRVLADLEAAWDDVP